MTPLNTVYTAFFSKMSEDDWTGWNQTEVEADLETLLNAAIGWFKFPRQSLEYTNGSFVNTLTQREILIIAEYMKMEWLSRTILTWENVKPLYDERDYSPANFLNRLNNLLDKVQKTALKLESIYYRSIDNRPFDYGRLAGNGGVNNE